MKKINNMKKNDELPQEKFNKILEESKFLIDSRKSDTNEFFISNLYIIENLLSEKSI